MTENVVKLRKFPKMSRNKAKPTTPGQVVELPMPDMENLTPQQVLEKLSRDPSITKFVLVIPKPDENDPDFEKLEIFNICMSNAEALFYAEKVKMWAMGIEV
jgi:hypothetical protein